RARILFYFRALSFRDAAGSATFPQDRHLVVESRVSGPRALAGLNADLPTDGAFDSGLALRADCRSSRDRSCRNDCDVAADHCNVGTDAGRDRRIDIANSGGIDGFIHHAFASRRLRNFLLSRYNFRLPPIHRHRHECGTKTFWQHRRSGKSFRTNPDALRIAALPAAHHGDVALAAGESVAGVRARLAVNRLASRYERNFLAGCLTGGRAPVRARIGTRLAFPTFRSGAGVAPVVLVSGILCGLHCVSVCLPSDVCRKNSAVGDCCADRSVTLLSRLSTDSRRISERYSRSRTGGICVAVATRTFRFAQTHTVRKCGPQHPARILRRGNIVFYHADFSNSVRSTMDHRGLGARRGGALLAFSSRATSRVAADRCRVACNGVRASRAQPGRAQLSRARRASAFELVSLYLSHRDCVFVRRCIVARAATSSRARSKYSPVALHAWHRARVSAR